MTNVRRRATDPGRPSDYRTPGPTELRDLSGIEPADEGIESDGGAADAGSYATYAGEAYGYRIAHPADWSVEAEATGGVSFCANGASAAGAVVFVDEGVGALGEYVETFVETLRADEHARAFEPAVRRDVRLRSGHPGQVVECSYVGDAPDERWRLMYLLTVVDGTGYTVGVDWNDADPLRGTAALIVGSFAVEEGVTE